MESIEILGLVFIAVILVCIAALTKLLLDELAKQAEAVRRANEPAAKLQEIERQLNLIYTKNRGSGRSRDLDNAYARLIRQRDELQRAQRRVTQMQAV